MSIINISANKREKLGKSANIKLRNNGRTPIEIYGKNKENKSLDIDSKKITQILHKGNFYTQLYEITLENKKITTIAKEIALHPVTDEILHIDFYEVDDKDQIKIKVNLNFLNENICKGVKEGGVLNITNRKIEISCLPQYIVNKIDIDLLELNIGQSIHAENISLPENISLSSKPNLTIVTVVGRATEDDTKSGAESQDAVSEEKEDKAKNKEA